MWEFSILKFIKRIQASIVYQILIMFIIEKKCAKDIQKSLKRKFNNTFNYNTILKFFKSIRQYIFKNITYFINNLFK